MTTETERKFLCILDRDELVAALEPDVRGVNLVEQRYLSDTGDWAVRLRTQQEEHYLVDGEIDRTRYHKNALTLKRRIDDETSWELECYVEVLTARQWLRAFEPKVIRKMRYEFEWNGLPWMADVFLNPELSGLILLECEFSPGDHLIPPIFAGEEVTADIRYRNFNMYQRVS